MAKKTPQAYPNAQYPQNDQSNASVPTIATNDDTVKPPDEKPQTDQSNALAVDQRRTRRLKNLRLDRVDLVTAGANQGAHVNLFKFEDRQIESPSNVKSVDGTLGGMVNDENDDVQEVDEVEKAEVTPKQRVKSISKAQIELQKALEAEVQKNLQLAERVQKMEDERMEAEFIAKAKELDNLGNATELGGLLLAVKKGVADTQFQTLERLLKAANAQMEKGALFSTLGRSETENPTVNDRINELAKAKLTAGTAKTIELAKLDVLHENPDLRAELNAQRS